MRYNAYHLSKNDLPELPMRYGFDPMEKKYGGQNKGHNAGPFEVQRVSPYEFCLTAEPCLVADVDAATSVVYSPKADVEPAPIVAQSLTFAG